jgi:hypothetical protein
MSGSDRADLTAHRGTDATGYLLHDCSIALRELDRNSSNANHRGSAARDNAHRVSAAKRPVRSWWRDVRGSHALTALAIANDDHANGVSIRSA